MEETYALASQSDIKMEFLHYPQVWERSFLPCDFWTIVASGFASFLTII